jgi:succinoglycan biosynthesis transport protein ExoP
LLNGVERATMSSDLTIFKSLVKSATQCDNAEGVTNDSELTIRGLLLLLKRRRTIILRTMSVCFLLAIILCTVLKPRYKALGEIQVQKSATDGLGLENLTGPKPESSDSLEDNIDLQTQANILQSYSLALKVIDDLKLESTEDFKSTFNPIEWTLDLLTPGKVQDPPNATLDDAPHRRDLAVKVFEKHLKIEPQSGTRLIDIKYTGTDPRIAAAVVNDLAKSLVDYTLNSRFTATSEVSGWLTRQLADIKKEAEDQQGKLEKLQRESGVYSLGIPDASGKEIAYSATLDRLQQATQELSSATSNRILKGALYKTIENGDPELISGLAGSSLAGSSPAVNNSFLLLQTLRTQQATMASQIAADTSKYGSANPKLGDEKASLDSISAQIKSEAVRIGERAANDYKASQATENSTREVYEQARHAADVQNDKAIALLIARQEATDARSLYQTLYSHLKEAGVIEGLRSSNVAVVDPGRIPSKPVPYILIIPALSLVLGGFFGIAGALLVESTSDRIEGMTSIENSLQGPILAVLPMTQTPSSGGMVLKFRRKLGNVNQDPTVGRIAVLDGPNTAYVEAIRGLRTELLQTRSGSPPKTILITSAGEREGKSTLSLNLAAALVLNGSRVLLVDGDMRSSDLSDYMRFERKGGVLAGHQKSGLSDALSGSDEPAVITPFPELPNLSGLPAGSNPRYPAELLGSKRMQALVGSWSANYDYVLIDSPPVLAVTDAVILSRLADMTLLVVRHGQSTQKSLDRAYRTLRKGEGRKVEIVVNGVRRDSVSFDEFYGYKGTSYYSEA